MSYKGFGYLVDSCPLSKENTVEAATRLNCSVDVFGRSQYVCVPNEDLTAIVEFCYTKSIVGFYQAGNCLKTIKDGFLDQISCKNFTEGCPGEPYRSTDLYEYPACSRLNTECRCFNTDSFCISYCNASRTAIDDGSVYIKVILGVVLPLLVLVGILIAAFLFRRHRQRQRQNLRKADLASRMKRQVSRPGNMESLLLFEDMPGNNDPDSVLETNFSDLPGTNDPDSVLETPISDKLSTLTHDEVSVLFCFLCSDSGPPDFTDTEWLDLLTQLRQGVYRKENLVTREEAQHTLDRLRSRYYLWVDQTKEHLNEAVQDEIIHRVSSISINGTIFLFYLSSFITAQRYLRSEYYKRKNGENCVISLRDFCDTSLILRLQINILTHVTMEDRNICYKVFHILNIPMKDIRGNEIERTDFQKKLKQTGERIQRRKAAQDNVDHVTWLWRYCRPDIVRSCIGLHPHWDIYIIDNKAYRKPSKYHTYPPDIRCLLYCVLLVDNYSLDINDETHKVTISELTEKYFTDVHLREEINLMDIQEKDNDKQENILKLKSDNIRHNVMSAFVTECLVEDSDLEFFLTTASREVISEYCRSWNYERSEGERCLYIPEYPEKMYDLFIDKLQLEIITHCTVSDKRIHDRISTRLNIPKEVLSWDINAKERFVKNLKEASKEMFRARGMIVGCAGAGKTTLLRKLHGRKRKDENKPTETTVGLEVHEDLFTIKDNKLIEFKRNKADRDGNRYIDNKVISMTDFAGQVAYYACHQVYLSRRAFYIVVVDMSKKLHKESRKYDRDRHDPTGSLFHSWTYGDYFHFWLQTIHTYCNDGRSQMDPKDTITIKENRANVNFQPVILVATHKDKLGKISQTLSTFFSQLEECLSKEQSLKKLISPYRYFEVQCPPKVLTTNQQNSIDLVKKCIVETVQQLPQWGERIPLKWFEIERILNQKKLNGDRVLHRHQLMETAKTFSMDENDLNDVLLFLHEIGKILYFSECMLKEIIIIDVQWFVDAFKYIITDEKHFARKDNKNILVKTGKISESYIEEVWKSIKDKHNSIWKSYVNHKKDILQYMDKLGLMTRIETKGGVDTDEEIYYIPSMNRTDLSDDRKDEINRKQKTIMMVYFFKSYLPHFFFFRLVVHCIKKWKVCDGESFFKNAAFYKAEEAGHFFAIAVNKTSIQLQVFTQDEPVKEDCVKKIRKSVEGLIKEITETFYRGIMYDMGFSCRDIKITDEDEEFFLKESEIIQEIKNSKKMSSCPRHFWGSKIHKFDSNKIRMCLLQRGSTISKRDN